MNPMSTLPNGNEIENVGGNAAAGQVVITRPSNTTPYGAGAVVGGVLHFPAMGPTGAELSVFGASLLVESAALISGEGSYSLHLYNATPPSAYADGATWGLPSTDWASYQGFVTLGTPAALGATALWAEVDSLQKAASLLGNDLWGYLVTTGGYTPTAGRIYMPTIHTAVIGA